MTTFLREAMSLGSSPVTPLTCPLGRLRPERMETVFYDPVPTNHGVQLRSAGGFCWQGRDDVNRFNTPFGAVGPAGAAGDLRSLGGVQEQDAGINGALRHWAWLAGLIRYRRPPTMPKYEEPSMVTPLMELEPVRPWLL